MVAVIKRNRRIKELRDIPPPEERVVVVKGDYSKAFKRNSKIKNVNVEYLWALDNLIGGKPNSLVKIMEAFELGIVFYKKFKGITVDAVRSPQLEWLSASDVKIPCTKCKDKYGENKKVSVSEVALKKVEVVVVDGEEIVRVQLGAGCYKQYDVFNLSNLADQKRDSNVDRNVTKNGIGMAKAGGVKCASIACKGDAVDDSNYCHPCLDRQDEHSVVNSKVHPLYQPLFQRTSRQPSHRGGCLVVYCADFLYNTS